MTLVAESEPLLLKTLTARYGVSRQTLHTWRSDLGCPVASVAEADAWVRANKPDHLPENQREVSQDRASIADLKRQLLLAQIRAKEAEATQRELENAEQSGDMVSARDVTLELTEFCVWLRCRLQEMPDQIAMEMPGEVVDLVVEIATRNIDSYLNYLSQWKPDSLQKSQAKCLDQQ